MTRHLSSIAFKATVEKIIRNRNEESEAILELISGIIGDRSFIMGKVFNAVANIAEIDIDLLCSELFEDYKWELVIDLSKAKTKLQAFIMIYANSNNSISTASGMEKSRFSRLQNGELQELYADEVYGLAKAFGLKPSQLFNYFYGDGERPVVGL
ncbi:hypothetical protein FAZ15_14335 [Sphingobacterium olei]|uniref:HTH cro/C1-type domain-containing protein n=1 Tax=Sphingobacterium olei TaxID=2571155 RepID=A0A4U0NZ03_9SPHI|nr:helix-turn-helix domain-containing protein [Sphingobacterium olei]TJZ60059.1 hypothetical protein FAZ15_14335 [Sphingobacterium olei]